MVTAEYSNGAGGTLHYSWEIPAPFKGLRMSRVFGTEGHVLFESNGLGMLQRSYGWLTLRSLPRINLPGLVDLMGYRAMFWDFLQAIRTDREPGMTLAHARRDVELVEDFYRTL
ncbi:hypothetical protein ACFL3S_13390 [Gemmatimonadota bacterium]